jgi:hypothetical protein
MLVPDLKIIHQCLVPVLRRQDSDYWPLSARTTKLSTLNHDAIE